MKPRSNIRSLFGRRKTRSSRMVAGRKCPVLENLEHRLLLSTLTYNAVNNTPVTLLLAGNQLEVVETASPSTVLASNRLNQTTASRSEGTAFNVSLTIDASVPTISPGGVLFRWRLRNRNADRANDQTNAWHITGTDMLGRGTSAAPRRCNSQHVTNLTGNAGADTFVVRKRCDIGRHDLRRWRHRHASTTPAYHILDAGDRKSG